MNSVENIWWELQWINEKRKVCCQSLFTSSVKTIVSIYVACLNMKALEQLQKSGEFVSNLYSTHTPPNLSAGIRHALELFANTRTQTFR